MSRLDDFVNRFRMRRGKRKLRVSASLKEHAARRAKELYTRGFFHDTSFEPRHSGICGWGENISWYKPAPDNLPRWAFRAFRDSPVHRANMLGRWTQMASAIYIAPNGASYCAQIFERRCR